MIFLTDTDIRILIPIYRYRYISVSVKSIGLSLVRFKNCFGVYSYGQPTFVFLKKLDSDSIIQTKFRMSGLDGRAGGRTESDYNATCVAPTDQLKLVLAQLSLSVWAECGKKYANMSIKRIVLIRLIDLQALKSIARNRIRRKMQKN